MYVFIDVNVFIFESWQALKSVTELMLLLTFSFFSFFCYREHFRVLLINSKVTWANILFCFSCHSAGLNKCTLCVVPPSSLQGKQTNINRVTLFNEITRCNLIQGITPSFSWPLVFIHKWCTAMSHQYISRMLHVFQRNLMCSRSTDECCSAFRGACIFSRLLNALNRK